MCARSPQLRNSHEAVTHHVRSADAWYDRAGAQRLFARPFVNVSVRVRHDLYAPPTIVETRFFDSGAGATIDFDGATDYFDLTGMWDCGRLFNNSHAADDDEDDAALAARRAVHPPLGGYFGGESWLCAWETAAKLRMYYGQGAPSPAAPRRCCSR